MIPAFAFAIAPFLTLDVDTLPEVHATFPVADEGVLRPRNLRPLAFGAPPSTPGFTLVRSDDSVVAVEAVEVDAGIELGFNGTRVFAVTLPELAGSEAVRLEVVCDACTGVRSFGFAIGDEIDEVTPTFREGVGRLESATGIGGNVLPLRSGFEVSVCLPSLQESEDVMVRLSGPDLLTPILAAGRPVCSTTEGVSVTFQVDGGVEREICVDAVAIDVAGQESVPITVCGDLVDRYGCAAARLPPPVSVLGLSLIVLRRRRRS